MGTWGTDPRSSDDFGDLWDGFKSAFGKPLEKLMRQRRLDPAERWARVGVLIQLAEVDPSGKVFDTLDDDFEVGIDDVDQLMVNEEWIGSWKSPAAIRKALQKARKDLAAHVRRISRR
jgi:hypothetical protein